MADRIRIQKYFTDCGVLSRRAAEAEIEQGKVIVNGTVAKVGDKIDPAVDIVEYQGNILRPRNDQRHRYLMLNKPRGYVTTSKDEKGRRTVIDLVKNAGTRVYPIGRLDMDSEGLLLLTDDGEFANLLTHPRHNVPKIYHVTVRPAPTEESLKALTAPMTLDGYRLQPIGVRLLTADKLEITLYEGRNRQIRRMCEAVGLKVLCLRRIAIGKLTLGELPSGKWRELTQKEVSYLISEETQTRKDS